MFIIDINTSHTNPQYLAWSSSFTHILVLQALPFRFHNRRAVPCNVDRFRGIQLSRHHTLPESVGLPNDGLPEAKGAVLAATRVELAVWRELDTVDGAKVAFEGLWKRDGIQFDWVTFLQTLIV